MWGLTGNMDPRLVSDGKALDVAYDAGVGKPKRTAEVIIDGKYSHVRSPHAEGIICSK